MGLLRKAYEIRDKKDSGYNIDKILKGLNSVIKTAEDIKRLVEFYKVMRMKPEYNNKGEKRADILLNHILYTKNKDIEISFG